MIIVIGSGVAGLSAALEISRSSSSDNDRVVLVTKSSLRDSNTDKAQGGVAVAMFPGDSPQLHASDTVAAGAGLNDADAVKVLTSKGASEIRRLISDGAHFDPETNDQLAKKDEEASVPAIAHGYEAAHSFPRVIHADGDATGREVERALAACVEGATQAEASDSLDILENTMVRGLMVDRNHITGVRVVRSDGSQQDLEASRVILATGGAGRLYSHTSNPEVATGDGVALAWRAGAVICDPEFYQFHPTIFDGKYPFLVTEAVRGAGGILLDRKGNRFMPSVDPRAELAPRDVVARAIARTMAAQGGQSVLLDATGLNGKDGKELFSARFPTVYQSCLKQNVDPQKEPIPVSPAAHYWMGGVRTDVNGRTSIVGLYAAGEVASTGVQGANRLASNSLLEGMVFGNIVAKTVLSDGDNPSESSSWPSWTAEHASYEDALAVPSNARTAGNADSFPTPTEQKRRIAAAMWDGAGVFRSAESLAKCSEQLAESARQLASAGATDPSILKDREYLEARNMATIGQILCGAALERTESRGGHYRSDYPKTDPTWRRHTYVQILQIKEVTTC